jgi:hypothetical protein
MVVFKKNSKKKGNLMVEVLVQYIFFGLMTISRYGNFSFLSILSTQHNFNWKFLEQYIFFQFYRPPDSLNVICYSKLGETETVGLGPTPEAAQQVSASQLIAAVLSIDLEKKVLENATETLNQNQQQTSSGSVIFYS